jgi:hypothetical protein
MPASFKQYYEDYQQGALSGDRPCDTGQFWNITDNIKHLVDESPCYRVNWVSPPFNQFTGAFPAAGIAAPSGAGTYAAAIGIVHEFPVTMLSSTQFPQYDVRVATATTSGVLFVSATMSSVAAALGAGLEDANVLGVLIGASNSTTGTWVIDGLINSAARQPTATSRFTMGTRLSPATGKLPGFSVMARLQIVVRGIGMSSSGVCSIVGVQVREYPW